MGRYEKVAKQALEAERPGGNILYDRIRSAMHADGLNPEESYPMYRVCRHVGELIAQIQINAAVHIAPMGIAGT